MRSHPIVLVACLGAFAAAQSPERTLHDRAGVAAGLVSLNDSDGTLRAYGARYEAVFGDVDVDFQPALGVTTDGPRSLRIGVRSVRRDGGETVVAGPGERSVDGLQVRYRRPTFDEIYDVRADGMEQSFVFRALPQGTGDLVVRLALETPFAAQPVDAWTQDGIGLRLDGVRGEARIGAVTGIDADGNRCRGALRCLGDEVLELSLPADFVDSAALPLVLDPWISSAFDGSGGGGTFAERNADVAHDSVSDSYLIVWQREIAGVFQIRGRIVRCDGTVVHGFIGVNSSTSSKVDPAVAAVRLHQAFVVTWTENLDIRATAVANDGTLYTTTGINVASRGEFEALSDVGGQDLVRTPEAIVVWANLTTRNIEATRLRLSSTLRTIRVMGGTVNISARSGSSPPYVDSAPAISKSGHATGNHLIVWTRSVGDAEIRGQVVDFALDVVDAVVPISTNTLDDAAADCDGDGSRWIVAWEQREGSGSGRDIKAASVLLGYQNIAYAGAEVAIEADPGDLEHAPAVAFLRDSAAIGYLDESGGIDDAFVVRVDPFTAVPYAGREVVESSSRDQDGIALVAETSSGWPGESALAVWTESRSASSSTIRARCFDAATGVERLGGGCGSSGGRSYAAGAMVGNADFAHRLRMAEPAATALLVLSSDRMERVCGACTLVPDPFRGFLLSARVNTNGEVAIAMPVPNSSILRGATLYTQWVVGSQAPACNTFNSDFSDALRIEIQ